MPLSAHHPWSDNDTFSQNNKLNRFTAADQHYLDFMMYQLQIGSSCPSSGYANRFRHQHWSASSPLLKSCHPSKLGSWITVYSAKMLFVQLISAELTVIQQPMLFGQLSQGRRQLGSQRLLLHSRILQGTVQPVKHTGLYVVRYSDEFAGLAPTPSSYWWGSNLSLNISDVTLSDFHLVLLNPQPSSILFDSRHLLR